MRTQCKLWDKKDKWKINSKENYLNRQYKISQVVNYPENKNNSNINLGYQANFFLFLLIPKEGCYSYLLLQAMFSCKLSANVSNTLIQCTIFRAPFTY